MASLLWVEYRSSTRPVYPVSSFQGWSRGQTTYQEVPKGALGEGRQITGPVCPITAVIRKRAALPAEVRVPQEL
jgi:hypothetical protein